MSFWHVVLLENFADEREDEERNDCAPDEGVEDHDGPPDYAATGSAEGIGDNVAWLAEEAADDDEQHKMQDAQRHIGEQERFHMYFPFIAHLKVPVLMVSFRMRPFRIPRVRKII